MVDDKLCTTRHRFSCWHVTQPAIRNLGLNDLQHLACASHAVSPSWQSATTLYLALFSVIDDYVCYPSKGYPSPFRVLHKHAQDHGTSDRIAKRSECDCKFLNLALSLGTTAFVSQSPFWHHLENPKHVMLHRRRQKRLTCFNEISSWFRFHIGPISWVTCDCLLLLFGLQVAKAALADSCSFRCCLDNQTPICRAQHPSSSTE